jgi:CelD/BcsL family acetyltransferase involved in cellulose biosynthesis
MLQQARATACERSRDASPRPAPARPFAQCEVLTDIDEAWAPWAELEACAVATPYQSFAFLKAWLATIGRLRRVTPFILVARDVCGRPSALLPFARVPLGPLHVAEFLGGKDANFNMGLFRPGLAIDAVAVTDLLRRAASAAPRIAGFNCLNQPMQWQGATNPMAAIGGARSPSSGYKTALGTDYTVWLNAHYTREAHKKVRKKAQRLNSIGPVSHYIARDADTAQAILAAYAAQKTARMRELGLARSFDLQHLTFLAEASDVRSLELHALYCGERIVAAFGGLARGDRFCGMFISYDAEPQFARCSPGELLLNEIVANLIERRFSAFDLGVGEARYKAHCCEIEEALFDTFVSTSGSGKLLGVALRAKQRVKRLAKQSPAIWALIGRLRRRIG